MCVYNENNLSAILKIKVEELKIFQSYQALKEFVNDCEITITETEIIDFLERKRDEENPTLRSQLENLSSLCSRNLVDVTLEDISRSAEEAVVTILAERYKFDPYTLQYFKIYISILKEKCKTFFEIVDDLAKIKDGTISEKGWERIQDLDFHVDQSGNLFRTDVTRLVNAILYNVKDLYDKVLEGNNPATYLTFKLFSDPMIQDDMNVGDLYPRKEVQIKDLYYSYRSEFIALSDHQKEVLEQKRLDRFSKTLV